MKNLATLAVIFLLVLFSIYRRTRRAIGFQKYMKSAMIIRMTMFVIIGAIFLVTGFLNPLVYIFDAAGIALGGILAFYAIRSTTFEWRNNAWCYRSNPWIGVTLLVLFVGRLLYRLYQDYTMFGSAVSANGSFTAQPHAATYSSDPITAITLTAVITYYFVYYLFLIRRERSLEKDVHDPNA